jgi:NDP-sugar pyrophosphorylase family protein
MFGAHEYFDLTTCGIVGRLFADLEYVWDVLPKLPELLERLLSGERTVLGEVSPQAYVAEGCPLYIGAGARVEAGAYISGPVYIDSGAVVRHGAYVRQDCILLEGSVLGHGSEAKRALLLPGAKAPHFAYVGDSVVGQRANLGAGTKLSNVPISRRGSNTVRIRTDAGSIDTGLEKFGAIVGDDVEVGCNAVLNPGSLLGPRVLVYPNTTVANGVHPANMLAG